MTTYLCTDGNGDIDITADSPEEAAQQYVDGGDWGSDSKTWWIDVRVTPYAEDGTPDSDASERHTIQVDPIEPDCTADEHDWQSPIRVVGGLHENPGVYGHGGGVVFTEVCAHCGCYRITDTWAQRSDTGEQGLRSLEYREADEESERWAKQQRIQRDDGVAYVIEDDSTRVYALELDNGEGWVLERQLVGGDETPERLSDHDTEKDAMVALLDYVKL